jgi:predicted  nucleic acid-binding Zn-ribbon protein
MLEFDIEVLPPAATLLTELDRLRIRHAHLTEENTSLKATVAQLTETLESSLRVEEWQEQVAEHQHELEDLRAKYKGTQTVSSK